MPGPYARKGAGTSAEECAECAVTKNTDTAPAADPISRMPAPAESTAVSSAADAEAAVFEPSAGTFNLAYVYPDGADSSDPLKSYGGESFRSIYEKDTDWYAEIFNATDTKPADLAVRLGRDKSSVMGKYDIQDSSQDVNNPDTWTVNKWSKINVNITDANGKAVDASSNAKEILAMASVYGYYHDWTNYQDFLNYAVSLWKETHSYHITMGAVYYDAGCITEEKKKTAILKGNGKGSTAATVANADLAAGTGKTAAGNTLAASGEEIPLHASRSDASEASSQNVFSGTAEESAGSSPRNASASDAFPSCPGHLDLTVSATVYGFDGTRNLFQCDRIGNARKNMNDRWQGWTAETMQQAIDLANADWYRDYGLSVSAFSKRTPLTDDEIYSYLTMLPQDLSTERRRLIICALRSIGNIPYFFGGKPAAAGYEGNRFFSVVSPDYKGRVFRGLDCSGWINWVYWTALGQRLAAESTGSLVGIGKSIRRNELKPGDLIVRPGSEETIGHVIMFLKWADDGSIACIHETGGHINNVTLGQQTAEWNYRSLLD